MFKNSECLSKSSLVQHRVRLRASRAFAVAVLVSVIFLSVLHFPGFQKRFLNWKWRSFEENPFSWNDVTPSTSLEFQPCHDTYQCTKLSVPLDWTASETKAKGKRVSLAVIRLPAKVPVTDPRYGGSIFVNPGGPGGSGIAMILAAGELLRTIVEVPTSVEGSQSSVTNPTSNATKGKFFDLIGWDPRGIGQTRPMANCFPDDVALMAWMQRSIAYNIPVSNESFVDVWTHEMSLARSCTWRLGDDDDGLNEGIGKFVSTPSVVEDLLAMTEALGEWREKEAKAELHGSRVSTELRRDVEKRMRWRKGEEKVQFWGLSYGTVIGATFATMHPNRIERMVLDGVVDSNRWYSDLPYLGIQDANKILEKGFEACYSAGPRKCAIYSDEGPSGSKTIFENTLESLRDNPLAVPAHASFGPEVVTYHDLLRMTIQMTYRPIEIQLLFQIIKGISLGNGSTVAMIKALSVPSICPSHTCKPWHNECHSPELDGYVTSWRSAVLCTDGGDMSPISRSGHFARWKFSDATSLLGGYMSRIYFACSSWGIRPAWHFAGPVGAPKTSHPILWMSNTRDPVTPLADAQAMVAAFPGSVLFGQDADGHATLSAPSRCVARGTRAYFQSGKLPTKGMGCKPDRGMFDYDEQGEEVEVEGEEGDVKLGRAVKKLATVLGKQKLPFGVL